MAKKLGFHGKLYVSANTIESNSVSWQEVTIAGDITPTDERVVGQVNDRSAVAVEEINGRVTLSHEVQVTHDQGGTVYEILRDAAYNTDPGGGVLAFAVMDGNINTVGSEGWQYDAQVRAFGRAEPLDDVMVHAMRISPYPSGPNTSPQYVEVSN